MSMINRHPLLSYVIAAAGVVLAGLSPWWVTPLTGDTPPMRLMLVVVVGVSAWLGGLGPGLFATAMGAIAIVIANDRPGEWATLSSRLMRFGMPSVVISLLFRWLHASRRRAEIKDEEFRRSEGRYRRLIETAGQGIWVVNGNMKTSYANPRMGEILGMPPAGMIGRPLSEFLVDDDASWSGSEDQPDPFAWHEIRLRGGDGAVRHAIITSQRVEPDELPGDLPRLHEETGVGGLLLMVTDVTSLKNAEAALREKESVLRSFYDSSQMAMGVVEVSGRDARFVSANTLSETFFGRRDRHAGRENGPAAQSPARDAEDLDRSLPRVPARPAGPSGSSTRDNARAARRGSRPRSRRWNLLGSGTGALLVHRRRYHRPQTHRSRPARCQGTGRGGVACQGPIPRRSQPRAANASDSRADRRRVAPGIEARGALASDPGDDPAQHRARSAADRRPARSLADCPRATAARARSRRYP